LRKHIEVEESKQKKERVASGLISAAEQHIHRDPPKFLSYLIGTTLSEDVEFPANFSVVLKSLEIFHLVGFLWPLLVAGTGFSDEG
jgi:hypothetical protein